MSGRKEPMLGAAETRNHRRVPALNLRKISGIIGRVVNTVLLRSDQRQEPASRQLEPLTGHRKSHPGEPEPKHRLFHRRATNGAICRGACNLVPIGLQNYASGHKSYLHVHDKPSRSKTNPNVSPSGQRSQKGRETPISLAVYRTACTRMVEESTQPCSTRQSSFGQLRRTLQRLHTNCGTHLKPRGQLCTPSIDTTTTVTRASVQPENPSSRLASRSLIVQRRRSPEPSRWEGQQYTFGLLGTPLISRESESEQSLVSGSHQGVLVPIKSRDANVPHISSNGSNRCSFPFRFRAKGKLSMRMPLYNRSMSVVRSLYSIQEQGTIENIPVPDCRRPKVEAKNSLLAKGQVIDSVTRTRTLSIGWAHGSSRVNKSHKSRLPPFPDVSFALEDKALNKVSLQASTREQATMQLTPLRTSGERRRGQKRKTREHRGPCNFQSHTAAPRCLESSSSSNHLPQIAGQKIGLSPSAEGVWRRNDIELTAQQRKGMTPISISRPNEARFHRSPCDSSKLPPTNDSSFSRKGFPAHPLLPSREQQSHDREQDGLKRNADVIYEVREEELNANQLHTKCHVTHNESIVLRPTLNVPTPILLPIGLASHPINFLLWDPEF